MHKALVAVQSSQLSGQPIFRYFFLAQENQTAYLKHGSLPVL